MRVTSVGLNSLDQSLGSIHLNSSLALHERRREAAFDFLRIILADSNLTAIGWAGDER